MKSFKSKLFYQLNFFLIVLLAVQFPLFAQRRAGGAQKQSKQQTAKVPVVKSEEFCEGWRGKVTYVQNTNIENVVNKGKGYEKFVRIVQVNAEVNLTGGTVGAGKVSVASKVIQDTEEHRDNDCGDWTTGKRIKPFVDKHFIQFDETGAATGNVPVTVSIENGEYAADIFMPLARGTSVMRGKSSQKGYCKPENDFEKTENPIENAKQFDPVRFIIKGKVDPKNSNVLRGTLKYDPDITITWDLTRARGDCDQGDLSIANLKLEHHVFPDPTAWQEIDENTVDGNRVKITAVVSNSSTKPKSGTLTIKEATSGEILETKTVSVASEGETSVEVEWDTDGFAWTDAGAPLTNRRVEAALSNGETADAEVKVFPKPVVLVHGLWSNGAAWSDYHNYLEEAHSYAWKAYAVGADPKVAQMRTGESAGNNEPTFSIERNAQELGKQILYTQKTENAWRIDIVAHSMGGLISRFYIHNAMTKTPDGKPTVNNLVMLGTPNMGSPCANMMYPAYRLAGFEVEALRQLQTGVVEEFNSRINNRKGVKFAILAGYPVPRTCQSQTWGDGVVEIPSALWQVADRAYAPRIHTSLTGREDFFNFVKPRLAIGPKKSRTTASIKDKSNRESLVLENPMIEKNWFASLSPLAVLSNLPPDENTVRVVSSKSVKIAAQTTMEFPFEFADAKSGVSFVAPPSVTASLVTPNGEIVQTIEAGSPEAAQIFKTFYADKAGNYILRFENTGDSPANAVWTIWNETNPLALEFVEVQKQADGSVTLQAKLTNNGAIVKGATVSAKTGDSATEIVLLDDGNHGDGAANDGVYGGSTGKLSGEHFIEARAIVNNLRAAASTVLN